MAEAPRPIAIVVVHGVGASAPGAMLRQLCGDLAGAMTTRQIGAESYPELKPLAEVRFQVAYEVYWAGLKPGGDAPLARVLRPLHVLLALSRIGGAGWGEGRRGVDAPSFFGRVLHAFLWGAMLSSPALYFPLLHVGVLPRPWGALAAMLFFLPGWLLALSLRRLDPWARVSAWLAPVVAIGAIVAASEGWIGVSGGARLTGEVVNGTYAMVVELSALALVEIAFKLLRTSDRPPPICFFVRFATLTVPFTLLGGVLGSMAWTANLAVDHWFRPEALTRWGRAYVGVLPFDLTLLELAFAAATFTFGAVLVIAFILFQAGLRSEAPKALGLQLRDRIARAFVVLAVVNTAVAAFYAVNSLLYRAQNILRFEPLAVLRDLFLRVGGGLTGEAALAAAPSVFAIYAASTLRIVSFIPSLFGPLRQAAGIVAEVVLWLAPGEQLGYRLRARARMNALLRALAPDFDVQVVAYSQGTVIAVDALADLPADQLTGMTVDLLTAGSPLDSLYGRFLDMVVRERPASASSWKNFYRLSDYVGGPVAAADDNIAVAQDYALNHFNYFREPAIARAVGRDGDAAGS